MLPVAELLMAGVRTCPPPAPLAAGPGQEAHVQEWLAEAHILKSERPGTVTTSKH